MLEIEGGEGKGGKRTEWHAYLEDEALLAAVWEGELYLAIQAARAQ